MGDAHVTWLGHATTLIELGDDGVLVDPLLRGRCKRVHGRYRAVLITHAHVDHLNRWTLKKLDKAAEILVPRGASYLVSDLGFRKVTEVEPGDQLAAGRLDIIGVPTLHDRGRWRKGDSPHCNGYVVAGAGRAVHHAGDVDMSTYDVFDTIGRDFRLDATILPIGGMLPTWYYRWRRGALDRGVHIDPDTALGIADRLGAPMIPVHWGTLNLRLGQLASAPRRRLERVAGDRAAMVRMLGHGQALSLGSPVEASHAEQAHDGDADADEGAEDLVVGVGASRPEAPKAQ